MVMVFPIHLIYFDLYLICHWIVHDVRFHFSMFAVLSWVSEMQQFPAFTLSIFLLLNSD